MQSIKDIKIKLKKDLENQQGTISISLSNISIDIHGKDIIGNAIQEWLGSWFDKNNIQYRILPRYITQNNLVFYKTMPIKS